MTGHFSRAGVHLWASADLQQLPLSCFRLFQGMRMRDQSDDELILDREPFCLEKSVWQNRCGSAAYVDPHLFPLTLGLLEDPHLPCSLQHLWICRTPGHSQLPIQNSYDDLEVTAHHISSHCNQLAHFLFRLPTQWSLTAPRRLTWSQTLLPLPLVCCWVIFASASPSAGAAAARRLCFHRDADVPENWTALTYAILSTSTLWIIPQKNVRRVASVWGREKAISTFFFWRH